MKGRTIASVLGVSQLPMRTRQPRFTYADLLAMVAHRAIAASGLSPDEIDGMVLSLAPTTTLGVDEPQFWALAGLPGSIRLLGRVHVAAASGLAAFRLACTHVAAGTARHVLVLAADLADETENLAGTIGLMHDPFTERHIAYNAITAAAVQMAGYMSRYGVGEREMAEVVLKNRANGVDNEYAQLRQAVTVEEVLASPTIAWPIKRLDSSPRTSGAAAVVVGPAGASDVSATGFGSYAGGRNIGAHMVPSDTSYIDGASLAKAARQAYAAAGITRPSEEIELAEVYASFGIIELLSIEALGLAPAGHSAAMLRDGAFQRGSALPVNPSGGATCGSPISATGLIRVIEMVEQLRGTAGTRQIARAARRGIVSAIGGAFQLHEVGVLER